MYESPQAHLHDRQQPDYNCNNWLNKWNWDDTACVLQNSQNRNGRSSYGIHYARNPFVTTDSSITQGRKCILNDLECETGEIGSKVPRFV